MRKKLVSVLTWPLRALGKLLRALGKLLRAPRRLLPVLRRRLRGLGALLARLARLRGRQRIALLVALGVVLVVAVLVLRPGPDENERVGETLDRFAQATREKDYQRLCDELYADDLVERIRSAGLPCEVALRTGLENRQNPQLRVLATEVSGGQALARVRASAAGEVPAVVTVRLVKQGDDWRIASLVEPGASAATP